MWDKPWASEKVQSEPFVDGVGLRDGVDFLRALWDEQAGIFVLSVVNWSGENIQTDSRVFNLPNGSYGIYIDGELAREVDISGDKLQIPITGGGKLKDINTPSLRREQ